MTDRPERLAGILGRFDPYLKESRDTWHLSFSSRPTEVLLMAPELVKVKLQLKCDAQIVGQELDRIDNQVQILDLESQKVQERFTAQVAERLEDTEVRQARHQAVTSQLHEAVH